MKSTKKMILATLIGVLAIGSIGYSAMSKSSRKKTETASKSNLTRKFSCNSKDLTVENLSTNKVKLTDGTGKVYNLKLTKSASGEEYKGNGVSIQIKGNDAVFTSNGTDESCNLTSDASSTKKTASGNLLRKFSCDGYQDLTVENVSTDKVKLADGYGTIQNLNSAVSASGEKYADGNVSI